MQAPVPKALKRKHKIEKYSRPNSTSTYRHSEVITQGRIKSFGEGGGGLGVFPLWSREVNVPVGWFRESLPLKRTNLCNLRMTMWLLLALEKYMSSIHMNITFAGEGVLSEPLDASGSCPVTGQRIHKTMQGLILNALQPDNGKSVDGYLKRRWKQFHVIVLANLRPGIHNNDNCGCRLSEDRFFAHSTRRL
ncbi:hypothetical protein PoB_007154600 [Plakobranchus ocellatus]|uniref:Uncharacterized protein n=1 Tax=Plakobranchus ocellatus TaxID=259542 RepID=A0AAV4DM58_9GAST|nr:hypothetical protein PoB_007154600 [Plakobranchus ocellatus]